MGQLVLTRKVDEVIVIGGNIRVLVVDIRGDRVRLGVDAPKDVTIHREEIQLEIDNLEMMNLEPEGETTDADV